METDLDQSPEFVRDCIAALRTHAEKQRADAALLLKRAQAEEDRAASMERRLAERIAAQATAAE